MAAVCRSESHTMVKPEHDSIRLERGLGVEGDAHNGETDRHLSRRKHGADKPNLRQVHLIQAELHEELNLGSFDVHAGQMGENVTTRGIDLVSLPAGTRLRLGEEALIEVTGLRSPCAQLDGIQAGLMAATLARDDKGRAFLRSAIMAVVIAGGEVKPGDPVDVILPAAPHSALDPV